MRQKWPCAAAARPGGANELRVERPEAWGSRARPVRTAQARAPATRPHRRDARTNGTNAPTHARAHRRRPSKWRTTRRLPEPRWPPRPVHRAAIQRRPVQREGRPPLAGRLPPSGRGASGERGAPYMLSAGADASRSGMVPSDGRAARVVIGTHRRNCIARLPRGRGGKSGATRPRLLAAAAAQLAAEHGAPTRPAAPCALALVPVSGSAAGVP